ncbi:hypothetical protein EDL98_00165 [Ornithobacterium rhinotracheale]|uniref:hypothetical protein n=1 Tax=Ornithobacterium rhinotracheale TaxID=28251 RepID=UPI00129C3816|nr:hypothetical protein [Ornithobacterium rhinotracheale]MRJ09504.1 hypothetical protein [Ornithobacterium rhinotracheale]
MKKKYVALIFLIFFLGAFVFNAVLYDTQFGFFSSENLSAIIGGGASVCGFILSLAMLRFYQIKDKLG